MWNQSFTRQRTLFSWHATIRYSDIYIDTHTLSSEGGGSGWWWFWFEAYYCCSYGVVKERWLFSSEAYLSGSVWKTLFLAPSIHIYCFINNKVILHIFHLQ